jgi:hypothetical protein
VVLVDQQQTVNSYLSKLLTLFHEKSGFWDRLMIFAYGDQPCSPFSYNLAILFG